MRYRQIMLFFFAMLWTLCAQASNRGALFKVTSNGHTMHIFGTMHVGVSQFFPLESRVTAAVANASTLALEFDPDQSSFAIMRALQRHGLLSFYDDCYANLPLPQRQQLERIERQGGIDPATGATYKPALLATMLTLSSYVRLGYLPDLSTDKFLVKLARSGQARIVELESLDSQLALLDTLTRADQLRFLSETLSAIDSGAQQREAQMVVDAWGSADRRALDQIAEGINSDTTLSGRFARQVLLEGRNLVLADKLAKLLSEEKNTVAAIGVLHLLGKRGVPQLLLDRGITVERVY